MQSSDEAQTGVHNSHGPDGISYSSARDDQIAHSTAWILHQAGDVDALQCLAIAKEMIELALAGLLQISIMP